MLTYTFPLPNTLSLKFEAISLVNTIVFWVNNMYDEQAENNQKKRTGYYEEK